MDSPEQYVTQLTTVDRSKSQGRKDTAHRLGSADAVSDGRKEPSEPSKVPRSQRPARRAFKGFDDGFDITQIQPHKEAAEDDPIHITEDNSRKRSHSVAAGSQPEGEDPLLPGAAAMKRLKFTDQADVIVTTGTTPDPERPSVKVKSPKKEFDIQGAVRERRRAEEEAARLKEEELHQTLSDLSFEEMNRLAKVVDMEVRGPSGTATRAQKASERWDPSWTGRRNFKKFRRAGEAAAGRREHTIIVPLEEVKKRGQGIGEHYWLEPESSSRRRREREDATVTSMNEGGSPSLQTFASAPSHQEEQVPQELVDGQDPVVIDVDEPRATRQGAAAGLKRQASSSGRTAGSKKQRTFAVREESESEDEMKFRFRKKK